MAQQLKGTQETEQLMTQQRVTKEFKTERFERSEYEFRLQRTKQRMDKVGVEILIVSDPADMYYLTGYDATSYYVPQFVVVVQDKAQPFWLGRLIDAACAKLCVFMPETHIVGYPEFYIGDSARHPAEFVVQWLHQHSWDKRTIGIELDSPCLTPKTLELLRQGLPQATFKDTGALVSQVRMIKSVQEITYMRQSGVLSDLAMERGLEHYEVGVKESAVAATMYTALIKGTQDFGGDDPGGITIPTGIRTSGPHLAWTDDPCKAGEAMNVELGGCRYRYSAGLSRTFFLGTPPKKLADLAPAVAEGMATAQTAAIPGATCEEVEAAWRNVINRYGAEKGSRIGYAIGINFPGLTWIERSFSLQPGDTTVLQPNMTFHMMLGMWHEDWGFHLSETFRVQEQGEAESFSKLPRKLFVKSQ
jgi:ectoine hydrolase